MATIVVATIGCDNLHLTSTKAIGPVLIPGGGVDFALGSSADFCDECGEPAVVMGVMAEDVPDDFPNLELYGLRTPS